jgi:hypothetical protein
MLTIQQMIRAVRDLQKRVEVLEAAAKKLVDVPSPPVVQASANQGRRGRPPKITDTDFAEAPIDPVPPHEVVL